MLALQVLDVLLDHTVSTSELGPLCREQSSDKKRVLVELGGWKTVFSNT
jgi:hypothetical protein